MKLIKNTGILEIRRERVFYLSCGCKEEAMARARFALKLVNNVGRECRRCGEKFKYSTKGVKNAI